MRRLRKSFSLWTLTKTVVIESESEIYPSGGPNSQDPKQALGPGTVLGGAPLRECAKFAWLMKLYTTLLYSTRGGLVSY